METYRRGRGIASARRFGFVALAQVESPLEGSLADLPGAVTDDTIEQNTAVVLAAASLLVGELHELGRKPQGLRHVVLTPQYRSPFPPDQGTDLRYKRSSNDRAKTQKFIIMTLNHQ